MIENPRLPTYAMRRDHADVDGTLPPLAPLHYPGRGRPVLPAAQRGALCPVVHPCRGPLLLIRFRYS
eukprot:6482837-Pyramimonas_sp.AAC.1